MAKENKAIMRRAVEEVVNQGNLDLIDELVAPNFVDHTPFPGLSPDREGIRQTISMLREAFPDIHVTIEEFVAEGDKVVSRQSTRGTHKGEFMGVPPTEKEVTWTGILMFRISDGKIVDQWLEQDVMGLMQQLGEVLEITGSTGMGVPLYVHENEDETFYVADGEVVFITSEGEVTGTAGTCVNLPRGVPHGYRIVAPNSRMVLTVSPCVPISYTCPAKLCGAGKSGTHPWPRNTFQC